MENEKHVLTKEERDIYVFALRYAIGRRTCALDIVAEEMMKHIKDFESWELRQQIRDLMWFYKNPFVGREDRIYFSDSNADIADKFIRLMTDELALRGESVQPE